MKAAMKFKFIQFKFVQFKCFYIYLMFFAPQTHALEANIHAPSEAIDFIEMLGELDDDDEAALDAAIKEIEMKKNTATSGQNTKSQEMKK
jgi:hypothetical protein